MWLERNAPYVGFYVMAFLPKMSTINQYGWRFWNKRSRYMVIIILGSPLFVGLAKCFRSRLARRKKCVSHLELLFNFCATHMCMVPFCQNIIQQWLFDVYLNMPWGRSMTNAQFPCGIAPNRILLEVVSGAELRWQRKKHWLSNRGCLQRHAQEWMEQIFQSNQTQTGVWIDDKSSNSVHS